MKMFSIYDCKSEVYSNPNFLQSRAFAERSIMDCMRDPKHAFCMYPEDFTLFELGSWDDVTCNFTLHNTPRAVIKLIELKAKLDAKIVDFAERASGPVREAAVVGS